LSGTDLILFKRTALQKKAQDTDTQAVNLRRNACNTCEFAHANCHTRPVIFFPMEFLLLWWDDLDDFTHACRHLATSAFSEVAAALAPLATGFSAICAWLLLRLQG